MYVCICAQLKMKSFKFVQKEKEMYVYNACKIVHNKGCMYITIENTYVCMNIHILYLQTAVVIFSICLYVNMCKTM